MWHENGVANILIFKYAKYALFQEEQDLSKKMNLGTIHTMNVIIFISSV